MMGLQLSGYIDLPAHTQLGGFDHAAIYYAAARLYVAHTANDALDVIDCAADRYLHSIPNLAGVAGVLASEEQHLIFTANRNEDTVAIFAPDAENKLEKIPVGNKPNGLAFDAARNLLLVANTGNPATLSIVHRAQHAETVSIVAPGRPRWTLFDRNGDSFYVNIADPAQIVVIDGSEPTHISRALMIPAAGPHGLDLDTKRFCLFCACDARKLIVIEPRNGHIDSIVDLNGAPDVIFYNATLEHLYVASGEPGLIQVFETPTMRQIESVPTEQGAHTIAFDVARNKVYAFLPATHRAAVYIDTP